MKYSIILDKVWVILEWIDENIEYEYIKVDYVDVFVYNWLKLILEQKEFYDNLMRFYVLNDIIVYKKGICGDYVILIVVMFLDLGVFLVYLLDISFENFKVGYVVVVVKIEGELFVFDQYLFLIFIGNYYWIWVIKNNLKIIVNIIFYEVRFNIRGELEVIDIWIWSGEELKEKVYILNEEVIRQIMEIVKEKFLFLYFQYKEDFWLKFFVEQDMEFMKFIGEFFNVYLFLGFSRGWGLYLFDEYFWLYYFFIIVQKFVDYLIMVVFFSENWVEVIQ